MSGLVTGQQLNESVGYVQTQVNAIQGIVGQLQANVNSGGMAIQDAMDKKQAEYNNAKEMLQADLRNYVSQVDANFQAMNAKAIELTAQMELHQQTLRPQQEIVDEVKNLKATHAENSKEIVEQVKQIKKTKLDSGDTTPVSKPAASGDPWRTWHGSAGAAVGDGGDGKDGGGGKGGGPHRGHEY